MLTTDVKLLEVFPLCMLLYCKYRNIIITLHYYFKTFTDL